MMTTHCLIQSKPDCSVRPAKKAVNQLASSGLFELIRAELWLQTHSKVPLNSFKALFVPAERESRQAFAAKWRHITQQTMCSAANSLAEWMREKTVNEHARCGTRGGQQDPRMLLVLLHLSDCRPVMFCGCCCWRQAPADCRLALGICAADAWRWRWRWLWPVRGRRRRRMPTSSSPASTTPAFACASLRAAQ